MTAQYLVPITKKKWRWSISPYLTLLKIMSEIKLSENLPAKAMVLENETTNQINPIFQEELRGREISMVRNSKQSIFSKKQNIKVRMNYSYFRNKFQLQPSL